MKTAVLLLVVFLSAARGNELLDWITSGDAHLQRLAHDVQWANQFPPVNQDQKDLRNEQYRRYWQFRAQLAEAKYRFLTGESVSLKLNDPSALKAQISELEASVSKIIADYQREKEMRDREIAAAQAGEAQESQDQIDAWRRQGQLHEWQMDADKLHQQQNQRGR